MRIKHNKKRNVCLLFEQLTSAAAQALVEGNKRKSKELLEVIKKYYNHNSEISKEFMLARSFVMTTTKSDVLIERLLSTAKNAVTKIDMKKLNQECSALIREINYNWGGNEIYSRHVGDYKLLASIQTLFNEWRQPSNRLGSIITLEKNLIEHLYKEKTQPIVEKVSINDTNSLVVKLMTEKLNKKFGDSLSPAQSQIIKEYVFSLQENNTSKFEIKLEDLRVSVVKHLDGFKKSCDNKILLEKIDYVIEQVSKLPAGGIDDHHISKFLTLVRLKEELTGE